MEEVETMIAQARQSLLAGPAASEVQRRDLSSLISQLLPSAIERVQRLPMSATVAKRAARFFAVAQDFVDTCLRSPLLGEEGPLRLNLAPLLHVLRILVSPEPVSPRFLPRASGAAAANTAVVPPHYFNRDHGKPLRREFRGRPMRVWPDDDRAISW